MQPVIPSVMRHSRGIDGAHRPWQRAGSLVWMLALLLGMASATPSLAGAQTSDETTAVLDGRIGGSLDAFEAKYGEPTNDPAAEDGAGVERAYANKNYREMVAISFADRISGVAFAANLPATPDDDRGTWSIAKATSLAKRFLPADVDCGDAAPEGDTLLRAQCTSAALAEVFSAADYAELERAGNPGTVSFTLTLDEADDTAVTAISAAAGTMSLEEEESANAAALAYLSVVKTVYDTLPETFATIDSAIGDTDVDEMTLLITLTYWNGSYASISELEPPAAYEDLHRQLVAILEELDLAATTIVEGAQAGDSAAAQLGLAHYYRGVMLYEEFKPVMEDALAESDLA